jgi:hypothetical protein
MTNIYNPPVHFHHHDREVIRHIYAVHEKRRNHTKRNNHNLLLNNNTYNSKEGTYVKSL